jgi:hypothetical protein
MEAIRSSEKTVNILSTRRHIPEDGFIHSHPRENLKSYTWRYVCSNHYFTKIMKKSICFRRKLHFLWQKCPVLTSSIICLLLHGCLCLNFVSVDIISEDATLHHLITQTMGRDTLKVVTTCSGGHWVLKKYFKHSCDHAQFRQDNKLSMIFSKCF